MPSPFRCLNRPYHLCRRVSIGGVAFPRCGRCGEAVAQGASREVTSRFSNLGGCSAKVIAAPSLERADDLVDFVDQATIERLRRLVVECAGDGGYLHQGVGGPPAQLVVPRKDLGYLCAFVCTSPR